MIPLSKFSPDSSLFNPGASINITNALPQADGWGPVKSFAAFSNALASQPYGAIDGRNTDGTYDLFAFTRTGAYKFNTTTLDFDDVTAAAGAYDLPNGDHWSTVQYGNYIIGTNITDGPEVYELGVSSQFAALSGSPPDGKFINTVGEYVVLMHTSANPNLVHFSGIGDSTAWTEGEKGSTTQEIPDSGPIMGSARTPGGLFVFCQDQINKFTFMPAGSYSFRRDVVNSSRGCVAPNSIVESNGTAFFLDEDGFYAITPNNEILPIGAEKVNRYFLQYLNEDFLPEVQGAVDAANKIVWWRYQRNDATYEMLGYDWQLGEWTRVDENVNYLFNVHSPGYTLDGLDNLYPTLDEIPYSLDSRVWKGGRPTFAGFDSDFKFGYFEGSNMAATLQTADVELSGKYDRTFVTGYRFQTDAATHTGRISGKDKHGDALDWSASTSPTSSTGLVDTRNSARLHRFELTIPAAESWTHAHSVAPEFIKGGKR